MRSPAVVYLDTQDYSRFGDVLRGVGAPDTEVIFREIEKRVINGDIVCAISMPILSELLQYHGDFRETTIKKAEAVERLCGGWALACPSRLIAAEVGAAAIASGRIPKAREISVLTSDNYWYPNVAEVLQNLGEKLKAAFDSEIAKRSFPERWQRRKFKRAAKNINFSAFLDHAAPQIAQEYGLPVDSIKKSIVAVINKKATPEEASRRLFEAIAKPTKFVELYFERIETDRSALPSWMSSLGSQMQDLFIELRAKTEPIVAIDEGRSIARSELSTWTIDLGRAVLRLGGDDTDEFGMDSETYAKLIGDDDFVGGLATPRIAGNVIVAYALQVSGVTSKNAKIERSFGGDLIHALYLPHVDLWRGDRRFSAIVKHESPKFSRKIVSSLQDLPSAIDRLIAGETDCSD